MNFHFKKIGMRNIKTGIAIGIAVILSKLLKLESTFYASIAVIITMQSSISTSFKAGRDRMLGTFVGAIIGFLFSSLLPGNALLCTIGVILIIYICNLFKWNSSINIAAIVFMAIMVNIGDKSPLNYSLYRLFDTFAGIIIALLINYFIAPPTSKKIIFKNLSKTNSLIESELSNLFLNSSLNVDNIGNSILNLKKVFETYSLEVSITKKDPIFFESIESKILLYENIFYSLCAITKLNNSLYDKISKENLNLIKENLNINTNNSCLIDTAIEPNSEVYILNFYITQILNDFKSLQNTLTI